MRDRPNCRPALQPPACGDRCGFRRSPVRFKRLQIGGTYQDEANLYILLEFVHGSELFSHLWLGARFSPDLWRFHIANLDLVLELLHKQDII